MIYGALWYEPERGVQYDPRAIAPPVHALVLARDLADHVQAHQQVIALVMHLYHLTCACACVEGIGYDAVWLTMHDTLHWSAIISHAPAYALVMATPCAHVVRAACAHQSRTYELVIATTQTIREVYSGLAG